MLKHKQNVYVYDQNNGHSCMDIEYVMQIVLAQSICPNQLLDKLFILCHRPALRITN